MASRLNPYLSFSNDARLAMEFYREVLGGKLEVNTFGEFGDQENADLIMHSMLETPSGFTLMAADTPVGMDHNPGNNVAISLFGEDEAELRGYWDKLLDGAQVTMPLETQVWGDLFGMLTDRFGIGWMVNIARPAES